MVFCAEQPNKTVYVGVGNGGIGADRVWLSTVSGLALEVLSTIPSPYDSVEIELVTDPLDIRQILLAARHMSKVMLLGVMTDRLQNGLLRELNVTR
jgi:hypothetical protein